MMEVPFLALSKNRKDPIIYEKHDGANMIRVRVSRHTGHFLASIYDWDIVLFVAGKMQEILNKGGNFKILEKTSHVLSNFAINNTKRGSSASFNKTFGNFVNSCL